MSVFTRRHSRVIFSLLIAGMSVTFLDQTILPVALPTMQKELSLDGNLLYWIVNCYFLAAAVLFIAGGRFSDGMGHRTAFFIGTLVFAIASLFCGLSSDGYMLCFGRLLQGAAVAWTVPSATALVLDLYPDSSKGRVMGLMIGISSLFLLLGPFLGGVITQFLSWRYIFFINIPLCLYAAIGALIVIPQSEKHPQSIDVPGFMLLILSIISLVYPLMQVHVWGWSSVKFWILIITACVFIGLLYTLSKRDEHPFVDPTLFKTRKFSGAIAVAFCTQFTLALAVFWPVFFQKVLKFSPGMTGVLMLLTILPVIICAPLAGKLSDKYGSYTPAKYGFMALAFCLVWSVFALPSLNIYAILFGMFFLGIGVTFISSSTGIFGLGAVDKKKKGMASGIYSTMRYLGLTTGIAVASTLIDTFQEMLFHVNLQYHSDTTRLDPKKILGIYDNDPSVLEYVRSLQENTQAHIYESLNMATAYAYSIATLAILGVVICGFAALTTFFGKNSENMEIKENIE